MPFAPVDRSTAAVPLFMEKMMLLARRQRSRFDASCCSVDVMNGALGWRWLGFCTTDRTVKAASARAADSAVARASIAS